MNVYEITNLKIIIKQIVKKYIKQIAKKYINLYKAKKYI